MVNKVFLIGRLGQDPELKYFSNGSPYAKLRLATSDKYTDRDGNKVDRTEWHSVVVFDRQAENCNTYLKKGSLICVEGSIQTRKYQDQQGQDRYVTEIRANRVNFLDRPDSHSFDGNQNYGQRQQVGANAQRRPGGGRNDGSEDTMPSESEIDGMPF